MNLCFRTICFCKFRCFVRGGPSCLVFFSKISIESHCTNSYKQSSHIASEDLEYHAQIISTNFMMLFIVIFTACHHSLSLSGKEQREHSAKRVLFSSL